MGMKKILNIMNNKQKSENSVTFKKLDKKDDNAPEKTELTETAIYDALKTVYDPELPVNIVDLGLIYDTRISSGNNVQIKMSLTTPGCAMGSHIAGQAEMALKNAGADNVLIEIVWDPPWNPDMMSEEARKKLGI